MKLVLFGAGAFGVPTFEKLNAEHDVLAVYTQPSRPAGRKRVLTPTPVGAWAAKCGLAVHEVQDVNAPEVVEQVAALAPEASVVIAFGQKLSPDLIGVMGALAMNLHSSLLPKYRGAAPIHWAVINGDAQTGVSVIGLAQRMDAGAVYARVATAIDPRETTGELHDRLAADLGPGAVAGVLEQLAAGTLAPLEQDHTAATRARKLTKADGTVRFDQSAAAARAKVHGLTPWPGCRVNWFVKGDVKGETETKPRSLLLRRVADHVGNGCDNAARPVSTVGVIGSDLRVACASGALELLELQAPGGKAQPFDVFVRGHGLKPGDWFEPVVPEAKAKSQ
ncbi:MAG: methionyl-tRNA formyltransferase [Algisphaera sp.]